MRLIMIAVLASCGANGRPSSGDGGSVGHGCGGLKHRGEICEQDLDCCSGICQSNGTCDFGNWGAGCDSAHDCHATCYQGSCRTPPAGASCTQDGDCEGSCTNGACACLMEHAMCEDNDQCCAGLGCFVGTCTAQRDGSCKFADDCVSRNCVGGMCGCGVTGGGCAVDSDCCSGKCYAGACREAIPGGPCTAEDQCPAAFAGGNILPVCLNGTCRSCVDRAGPCGRDADCCSGRCIFTEGPSFAGACDVSDPGERCSYDEDCHYNATASAALCGSDQRCTCEPAGGECGNNSDCCSGVCHELLCVGGPPPATCVPIYQASKTGSDCCNGLEAPAGPGTACCGAPGLRCQQAYDCCSNACGSDGRCH